MIPLARKEILRVLGEALRHGQWVAKGELVAVLLERIAPEWLIRFYEKHQNKSMHRTLEQRRMRGAMDWLAQTTYHLERRGHIERAWSGAKGKAGGDWTCRATDAWLSLLAKE